MDAKHNTQGLDLTELEKQAEELFPIKGITCAFQIKKMLWRRERWIKSQMADK